MFARATKRYEAAGEVSFTDNPRSAITRKRTGSSSPLLAAAIIRLAMSLRTSSRSPTSRSSLHAALNAPPMAAIAAGSNAPWSKSMGMAATPHHRGPMRQARDEHSSRQINSFINASTPSLRTLRAGVLLLIELPQQLGNAVGDLRVEHARIKRL